MSTAPAPAAFVPVSAATTTPAGTVIPLANARYILKAQYFDPVKNADTPLPPHQFFLFPLPSAATGQAPIIGEASDSSGMSWIKFEDDLRFSTKGGIWAIGWRPLLKKAGSATRATDPDVTSLLEVFLDLDKGDWVSPKDVGFVDKRRLIRLPLWASHKKAKVGGFADSPSKTKFSTRGTFVFNDGECTGYGTVGKPWLVQIDHKLFRSFLRFHYYNLKDKARKPVGRGIVGTALGVRSLSVGPIPGDTRARVAAGTAIDGDGTIYLLHERTQAGSKKVSYYFSTGRRGTADHGIITFADPPDAQVHVVAANPSEKQDERYVLPQEWHSFGMDAYLEDASAGVGKRKKASDLLLKGTDKAKPLTFHLDDAILASGPQVAQVTKANDRIALFDQVLHIRDEDPQKPHLWKTKLARNYLPAEEAVYVSGQGIEQTTRLVYRDGTFFDLREKHLAIASPDKLGVNAGVGARIALANDADVHKMVSYMGTNVPNAANDGHGEYHLIDCSYLPQPFPKAGGGTVPLKLMHLLIYLPVKIVPQPGASAALIASEVIPALTQAAERWDQKHPAHPTQPPANMFPMESVVVPVGTANAGDKGVRIRHYFGETKRADAIKLQINPAGSRGFANTGIISLSLGDIGPSNDDRFLEETGQPAATARLTLAHELGHQLGQPDEYDEEAADGFAIANEVVSMGGSSPPFVYDIEGVTARPYNVEFPAMMRGNNQPRLRHHWVYMNRLRREAVLRTALDNKDYVSVDVATVASQTLSSDLRTLPATVLPNEGDQNPWKPVGGVGTLTGGRADIAVYRLPRDIGTVKRMFTGSAGMGGTLTSAEQFDALALVYVRFLFDFRPPLDTVPTRRAVYQTLRALCMRRSPPLPGVVHRANYATPFCIVTPAPANPAPPPPAPPPAAGPPWRVALGISAQFDRKSRTPTPTGQHILIKLVTAHGGGNPLLAAAPGATLTMTQAEIGPALLAHALGVSPLSAPGVLKAALTAGDFVNVQRRVESVLGSAASSSSVVPFP
jgi:hypothetical protein